MNRKYKNIITIINLKNKVKTTPKSQQNLKIKWTFKKNTKNKNHKKNVNFLRYKPILWQYQILNFGKV